MGEEIHQTEFHKKDYEDFKKRLNIETNLVRELFKNNNFDNKDYKFGYELELCLIDDNADPCPNNQAIINTANSELLTHELARFNLEINGNPFSLTTDVFTKIENDLTSLWDLAENAANKNNAKLILCGILPSIKEKHLNPKHFMSNLNRYMLLSSQVIKMRNRAVEINLEGEQKLHTSRNDVMLESLGTSLQVHMQVPFDELVSAYNASLLASILMLAISANSKIVLGKSCWHESRIGVFEQAVDTRNIEEIKNNIIPRVHFSKGYINSFLDLFEDNFYYSPVLPEVVDTKVEDLHHLNIHNGTIWRWVRPIISKNEDANYALRLELRVTPSGPTLIDTMSNLVFYIALVKGLTPMANKITNINFNTLKSDFYNVAKNGINTNITWLDNKKRNIRDVILDEGLNIAKKGLNSLNIKNYDKWLNVIESRAKTGQTGAVWQYKMWQLTQDTNKIVAIYLNNARENKPVHSWEVKL